MLVFNSFLILSFMTIAETASTDCLTKDNFQSLLYAVYECSCMYVVCVYACMRVCPSVFECVYPCVNGCACMNVYIALSESVCGV